MKLEVDDNLPGEEKCRQLKIQMVAYALKKCGSKIKAGKFLGYSQRWVRIMCQLNDELAEFRVEDPRIKKESDLKYVERSKRF